MTTTLTPPDLERCQAEKPGNGPFTMGGEIGDPKNGYRTRCREVPKWLARETEPGEDGQIGSMTLCDECLAAARKQGGADMKVTLLTEEDAMDFVGAILTTPGQSIIDEVKRARETETLVEEWDIIPMEKWGRDHQTLLTYIETRCVDQGGIPDPRHLRPGESGTRLPGKVVLANHSDWNCIDDLVAADMLIRHGTGINPVFELTDAGWELAGKMRRARAKRGFALKA